MNDNVTWKGTAPPPPVPTEEGNTVFPLTRARPLIGTPGTNGPFTCCQEKGQKTNPRTTKANAFVCHFSASVTEILSPITAPIIPPS